MNRLFNILLLLAIFTLHAAATPYTESFQIDFAESDYRIITDANGITTIEAQGTSCYPEGNEPGLPMVTANFAVNGNVEYQSSSLSYVKRLIKSDVSISQTLQAVPTSEAIKSAVENTPLYANEVFPKSNCQFVTKTAFEGATILHFLSTPFIYDAQNKNLYFIDSIELNVEMEQANKEVRKKILTEDLTLLRKNVLNPQILTDQFISDVKKGQAAERIDYVIITSESLKEEFSTLLNWKRKKGLYSKLITVEEIASKYPGEDLQLKIKNCLKDLYTRNNLKYALLGGDTNIVPVRGCKMELKDISHSNIPSDLYYAVFSGVFNWDENDNGIYGEESDNIAFTPFIHISRLPVADKTTTLDVVEKIIEYESNCKINDKILLSGVKLYGMYENQSDAEIYGEEMYKHYIKPYWNGERVRFFDTYTDFLGGKDFDVSAENLKNQIQNGYAFINMDTHGDNYTWTMENGYSRFNTANAKSIISPYNSVVTTSACYVNAFDMSSSPCLSESFITSRHNGVVAFWGSAREGWCPSTPKKGVYYSQLFNAEFYKSIFSTENTEENNFGKVCSRVRLAIIPYSNIGAYRWLLLSVNALGDPEMPIFVHSSQKLESVKFHTDSNSISINTGVPNCRICVMSLEDAGDSYYKVYEGKESVTLSDLPCHSSICITKAGYLPRIIEVSQIQNKTICVDTEINSDFIRVGRNVTTSCEEGNVIFQKGNTKIKGSEIILDKGTTVLKGATLSIENK